MPSINHINNIPFLEYPVNDMIGGRYRVIKPKGQGGMSQVYLVEDTECEQGIYLGSISLEGVINDDAINKALSSFTFPISVSSPNNLVTEVVGGKRISDRQTSNSGEEGQSWKLLKGNIRSGVFNEKPLFLKQRGTTKYYEVYENLQIIKTSFFIQQNECNEFDTCKRWVLESKILSKSRHPNIVKYLHGGTILYDENNQVGHLHYIVLECLEKDLDEFKKEKEKLGINEIIRILKETARGLKYLHDKGFFHRDIKPSNILIGPNNVIKVADLGLAGKDQEQSDLANTTTNLQDISRAGSIDSFPGGTLFYASPEQWIKLKNAEKPADIYSLGCSFFELLTGKHLFSGTKESVIWAHAVEDPPVADIDLLPLPVQDKIKTLLRDMLRKKPEDRIQSMEEFLNRLDYVEREFVEGNLKLETEKLRKEKQELEEDLKSQITELRKEKQKMTPLLWGWIMAITRTIAPVIIVVVLYFALGISNVNQETEEKITTFEARVKTVEKDFTDTKTKKIDPLTAKIKNIKKEIATHPPGHRHPLPKHGHLDLATTKEVDKKFSDARKETEKKIKAAEEKAEAKIKTAEEKLDAVKKDLTDTKKNEITPLKTKVKKVKTDLAGHTHPFPTHTHSFPPHLKLTPSNGQLQHEIKPVVLPKHLALFGIEVGGVNPVIFAGPLAPLNIPAGRIGFGKALFFLLYSENSFKKQQMEKIIKDLCKNPNGHNLQDWAKWASEEFKKKNPNIEIQIYKGP